MMGHKINKTYTASLNKMFSSHFFGGLLNDKIPFMFQIISSPVSTKFRVSVISHINLYIVYKSRIEYRVYPIQTRVRHQDGKNSLYPMTIK